MDHDQLLDVGCNQYLLLFSPVPSSARRRFSPICPARFPTLELVPTPNSPSSLKPQQPTRPSLRSAQLWKYPEARMVSRRPKKRSKPKMSVIYSELSSTLCTCTQRFYSSNFPLRFDGCSIRTLVFAKLGVSASTLNLTLCTRMKTYLASSKRFQNYTICMLNYWLPLFIWLIRWQARLCKHIAKNVLKKS